MQSRNLAKQGSYGPIVKFPFSMDQCEILCALEASQSASALTEILKRDASVISRQLKKIAETAPVIEKIQGRWTLTPLGKDVAQWARNSAGLLNHVMKRQSIIRVGATREFAARVLCPQIKEFLRAISPDADAQIILMSSEAGIEDMILNGEVDFGFDCGRPRDPQIQFKTIVSEPLGIFLSPQLIKKRPLKSIDELLALPNLQYRRVSTAQYLRLSLEVPIVSGYFNDLASIREACVAGFGWAVLPLYAVRRETKEGALIQLDVAKVSPEKYGLWWRRGNAAINGMLKPAENWLKTQENGFF